MTATRRIRTRLLLCLCFAVAALSFPISTTGFKSPALAAPRTHRRPSTTAENQNRVRAFLKCAPAPHRFLLRSPTSLRNDLRDEIERSAQRRAYENKARGEGAGSTLGGAALGALLLGPFGAVFGASVGEKLGDGSLLKKARQEEMARKGLTPEMLEQAEEIGVALRQTLEGLRATQESVDTSRRLAQTLDGQEKSLYERAKSAMASGDEAGARRLMLEREAGKNKLMKVLRSLAEERKRLAVMEGNARALETRGLEIDALLRRSVGAAALKESAFALEPEDPLLQKFRDLGM